MSDGSSAAADRLGAQLAALGPFFSATVFSPQRSGVRRQPAQLRHPAGDPVARELRCAGWEPLEVALADGAVVAARVDHVRGSLAVRSGRRQDAVPRLAAVSVAHQGMVARLLARVFAMAVLEPGMLVPPAEALWWQPSPGSLFALALPVSAGAAGPPWASVEAVVELVAPVGEGFARQGLPPAICAGNVASSVNSACALVATARPELRQRARALAAAVLGTTDLAGASTGAVGTGAFGRRSCCLLYQASGSRPQPQLLCADCVLAARGPDGPS